MSGPLDHRLLTTMTQEFSPKKNIFHVKVVVRKQKMKTENRTKRIRRFNGSLETRTVRGRERERETTENSISK